MLNNVRGFLNMFKKLFLLVIILMMVYVADAKSWPCGVGWVTDGTDHAAIRYEQQQDITLRNVPIEYANDVAEKMAHAYGYSPENLFTNINLIDLKLFRPVVPASLSATAELMTSDPEEVKKFINGIKKIFSAGAATSFNEAVKKKNQMANLMNAMSYGRAIASMVSTNEMKKAMNDLIDDVNQCEQLDCTIKHANKLDVINNSMLANQLLLIASDVEHLGFASLIATNDPKNLEETE